MMKDIKHNNRPADVLDELKHQYGLFSETVADMSNELAINVLTVKNKSAKPIRKVMSVKLKMLPAIFLIYTFFYYIHVVSLIFMIAIFLMVIIDAVGDCYLNRLAGKINIDTDLITYRLELLKTKRMRTVKLLISAPISILWAAWFGLEFLDWLGASHVKALAVAIGIVIAVVSGLCIELCIYRKMQRHTDMQLAQINALRQ